TLTPVGVGKPELVPGDFRDCKKRIMPTATTNVRAAPAIQIARLFPGAKGCGVRSPARAASVALMSRCKFGSVHPSGASSHWVRERKYSRSSGKGCCQIRKGMIRFLPLKAWLTSLRTWGEAAACSVRISTNARAELTASTMAVGKSVPGSIFLGAIQHEIPAFSKALQMLSAIALSADA